MLHFAHLAFCKLLTGIDNLGQFHLCEKIHFCNFVVHIGLSACMKCIHFFTQHIELKSQNNLEQGLCKFCPP